MLQWREQCAAWKDRWAEPDGASAEAGGAGGINLYQFAEALNAHLKPDAVVTWDAGSCYYLAGQALQLDGLRQRSIGSLAQAEMGAVIGMSVGSSLASQDAGNSGEVICLIGDGSFCTQLHELSVVRKLQLPIKIFVWNNGGYLSIRNSQKLIYDGRVFGADRQSGLFFPKVQVIARAYEIQYTCIHREDQLALRMTDALLRYGPVICEVMCDPNQKIWPTSAPKDGKQVGLDDMFPFL